MSHPLRRGVARRLPAGVIDAALASLATFITGLVAVNVLDDVERGVYAVFFTAFGLGTVLPNQLVYGPTEILAVEQHVGDRLTLLPRSIRSGSLVSILAMVSVVPAIAVTWHVSDVALLVPLASTCAATILLSPSQDHVRRMLHIDGVSWWATTTSGAQLAGVVFAIAALNVAGAPPPWIPFGALAIANLCSLAVARILAGRRIRRRPPARRVRPRDLWDLGSWLFVASIIPSVTAFGVAAIVTVLAGPEAIGFAEAARIVAQPVVVLGTGLTAVLAPRIMETSIRRDRRHATRIVLGYVGLVSTAAVVYGAVVGWDWALNPMARLVPAAFSVTGLVFVAIGVNVLVATAFLVGHELAAARQQRAMALVAMVTAPLRLLVALSAGATHAFARPLAQGTGMASNLALYLRLRRRHYQGSGPPGSGPANPVGRDGD